eukprot:2932687-Amphidinium_carterae.1
MIEKEQAATAATAEEKPQMLMNFNLIRKFLRFSAQTKLRVAASILCSFWVFAKFWSLVYIVLLQCEGFVIPMPGQKHRRAGMFLPRGFSMHQPTVPQEQD